MIGKSLKPKSTVAAAAVLFLFSCSNDVNEVKKLAKSEDLPLEVQENLDLTYSDSSYVRLQLQAPLAEHYPQLEEPVRKFTKGINVKFFDSFGKEDARLRADYATQNINTDLWHATGDVVVVNKKDEQLNTEELYWDQRTEKIYSDEFVKITTDKRVIMGEGFEADQNFDNYVINKVTGEIAIEDEKNAEVR